MKWGPLVFNDEEIEIMKDIAKLHNVKDLEIVKYFYAEMVKKIETASKN